ncbi:MAG: hypothetical protein LBB15_00805 [Puniceicoccales bacterium]|jgi:hypothetical protein|nr:hypothetical protein [Puniceicoccales bacterium]
MSVTAKIITLSILGIFCVIYGELRRKFLLRKIIRDRNLSKVLINCSEWKRFAKNLFLLVSGILLCLSPCEFKVAIQIEQNVGQILAFLNAYDNGILDVNILLWEISFCLLAIEQLIPTRKW